MFVQPVWSQITDFEAAYKSFKKHSQSHYADFRAQANAEYANFVRRAWSWHEALPAIQKPKEKTLPVIFFDGDGRQELKDRPVLMGN